MGERLDLKLSLNLEALREMIGRFTPVFNNRDKGKQLEGGSLTRRITKNQFGTMAISNCSSEEE